MPVPIRWSDIDGYGHVNNAAILTLLEEARVATFWDTGTGSGGAGTTAGSGGAGPSGAAGPEQSEGDVRKAAQVLAGGVHADSHTLVARQEIEYLAPLTYSQEPVNVQLWIGRIGGASLEVCYEVYAPGGGLCARAASSMVMVEAATGRPRRLTEHERSALQILVEEPLVFRRR
ncbi:acyl-CoA thioesterase [Pseudactinotalea sp. Z1748]|uniref:acyl-CoA thioesterase n=1 Tax=Pseudactinotalea sp. Z1748 TaxID=3413027 RepID=UPI003C797FB1